MLIIAINNSLRALLVPGFAMLMVILVLAGALFLVEKATVSAPSPLALTLTRTQTL